MIVVNQSQYLSDSGSAGVDQEDAADAETGRAISRRAARVVGALGACHASASHCRVSGGGTRGFLEMNK